MDFACGKPVLLEALGQVAHGGLAVAEHDGGRYIVGAQQIAQHFALGPALHRNLELNDVFVARGGPRDFDVLGVGQETIGQLLDRRGHRRREQQRLALRGQLGADRLDIGNEPHVEHPVGLVDHQHVATAEHDLATLEQIHQATRRGDQHIDAILQRLDLIAHLHAADQQRHLEIVVGPVLDEFLRDLRGKFARRFQDQAARHQRAAAAMAEDVDHRQHERAGLARAGLGDADDVAHHQDAGDRLRLDRRGRVIALGGDCREQFV